MDCCKHNQNLNGVFNEQMARGDVEGYWKKGIDKHARVIVEAVRLHGVEGASVLEVGGGVGGLHLELLKQGAARATDVDVSSAYVAAAQSVAEKLGVRERVDYRVADFAHEAGSVPGADVVVLHRVGSCYTVIPTLIAGRPGMPASGCQ
jgi:magnesium-protoporphyrin O-methyltransferase